MHLEFEYKSFSFKKKENYFLFNKLPVTQYSSKSPTIPPSEQTQPIYCIFDEDSEQEPEEVNRFGQFQTFWEMRETNVVDGFTQKGLNEMESLDDSHE